MQAKLEGLDTSRFASTSTVSCSILIMSCSVFADVLISSG